MIIRSLEDGLGFERKFPEGIIEQEENEDGTVVLSGDDPLAAYRIAVILRYT